MPPKRRGYWVYVGPDATDAPPKKKAATGSSGGKAATKPTTAAAALRRKGKSIAPDWTKRPEWPQDKPTGEWTRKCVDRWCLLAPYDTRITEDQWKEYYHPSQERFELDEVNTLKGDKSGPVVSEDLAQNTWEILRRSGEDVAAAILGSKLDDGERKNRIVYTLLGSLYFLSLMGQDEGDILPSPRNIDAQTRLYSPFGLGTSIDFHYSYHYRMCYGEDDRISSLDAAARAIEHCDAKNPRNCAADSDEEAEPITPVVAFNIFERASATIPESAITGFEEPLLGCKGWLSPMKLADLLLAAGTIMHCHEQDVETPESFPKRLAYFPGENKGKREMNKVVSKIGKLEIGNVAEFIANQDELMKRPICIPQGCLELARQADGASAALTSTANA